MHGMDPTRMRIAALTDRSQFLLNIQPVGPLWGEVWAVRRPINHIWSIGDSSPTQIQHSTTTIQSFINYNFKGGWVLSLTSTTTENSDAMSGQKWTVPVGMTLTKTFAIDKQPCNLVAASFTMWSGRTVWASGSFACNTR
jgi:hypothetical protein